MNFKATSHCYRVGGCLFPNDPFYIERKADRELYEELKQGEFCYVLNQRQMGKSSLRIRTIKKLKAEGVLCASIDLASFERNITVNNFYAGIIYHLTESLQLDKEINYESWLDCNHNLSPLRLLNKFIEQEILNKQSNKKIVIFIDEIDRILSFASLGEDFFSLIRYFYDRRAEDEKYKRLSFCILGVASPYDLMPKSNSTPFNIGYSIELIGFQLDEVTPLLGGITNCCVSPRIVIEKILKWTNGQPFLTQKICKLVANSTEFISLGSEETKINELVLQKIIENWEAHDEPQHLKTIRNRLFNSSNVIELLKLYKAVLQEHNEFIFNVEDKFHVELRLTGLTNVYNGKMKVANLIVLAIFTEEWVEKSLIDKENIFCNFSNNILKDNVKDCKFKMSKVKLFSPDVKAKSKSKSLRMFLIFSCGVLIFSCGFILNNVINNQNKKDSYVNIELGYKDTTNNHTVPKQYYLEQLIPNNLSKNIKLPSNASFSNCPENSIIYMVGETNNFKFIVCQDNTSLKDNTNLKYYIGQRKQGGETIIVKWNNSEFRNLNYVYKPPVNVKEIKTHAKVYLRVDKDNKLEPIRNEEVIKLHTLSIQDKKREE